MLSNISLKWLFLNITIAVGVISIFGSLVFKNLYSDTLAISNLNKTWVQIQLTSREFRQSSDDLTKFARLYVVTKDGRYLDNFHRILNIRRGTHPRPKNYHDVYWDLNDSSRISRHPDSTAEDIVISINQLDLTEVEISKLHEAERNSNYLTRIEEEAFNALVGLYKDTAGNYTVSQPPNQQLAIDLLHSKKYLESKHHIMLPIDEFLEHVQKRLQAQELALTDSIDNQFSILSGLAFGLLIVLGLIMWCVHAKLLLPLANLKEIFQQFKQDNKIIKPNQFEANEVGVVASEAYQMMELIRINTKALQKLAYTDVLTQTYNRKYFYSIAKKMFQIAERSKVPHVLMMLDLDYFKRVNDQYGHMAGDRLLTHTTKLIAYIIRKGDIFARYGGEEFIILLPNVLLDDAALIAEKIRKSIESQPLIFGDETISMSISIGIAMCDPHKKLEENINFADEALYRAKNNGRNQLCIHHNETSSDSISENLNKNSANVSDISEYQKNKGTES